MKLNRSTRIVLVATLLALVSAACGGGTAAPPTESGPASGSIVITGSSTVEPISKLVAENFEADHQGVAIDVKGPGTGDGFEIFCNGEADITDASRAIREEEAQACTDNGIEFIELYIAIDGLSVITATGNDQIGACLSFSDIYAVVGPESVGFETWAAANDLAAEIGGSQAAPFPDVPLAVHAPGEESGTYDSFIELVTADIAEERGVAEEEIDTVRLDYQSYPEDVDIITNIGGPPPTTFGWLGFSFYVQNQDQVRAFEIDGGDGCVAPTPEAIADGSYPIARPLYIYVSTASAERTEVAEFVDYYLSDAGRQAVEDPDVAYVNIPQDEWDATGARWEQRETGSATG